MGVDPMTQLYEMKHVRQSLVLESNQADMKLEWKVENGIIRGMRYVKQCGQTT